MTRRQDDGFVAFFRRYTKTSLHTVSTAALTAFGMLTFVNKAFAVVAIAAYVLPPVVQYFRDPGWLREEETDDPTASAADGTERVERTEPEPTESTESTGTGEPAESTEPTKRAGSADSEPRTAEEAGSETGAAAQEAVDADEGEETSESDSSESREPTDEESPEPEWVVADAPTDETLFDAVVTEAGAYAVGEEGVVVAEAEGGGGPNGGAGGESEWEILLSDGPGAASNDLTGVDAAADGGVWVAGESGAVGRIDPGSGRHVDFSAPDGDTNDVAAVAAAGADGTETVLLADGSGQVRRGRYRDGDVTWDEAVKPGSGSSIVGVELRGEEGYVCDSNNGVFRTADAGRTFESLGFEGENGTLTDVTAGGEAPLVSDDDGALHRYDGSRWTPERLADDPILAVAAAGMGGVAAGEETVYERFGAGWERASPPAVESLSGVAFDESKAVVVGEAGTVLTRVGGGGR
ncbi:hypothetical protein C474_04293 [Halogeometricum pallidum JCM 14848]|uniref:HVO-0234-like beta-propeller domain-containing protein n=1 Tax=Halogeometricum pallidum JCM 14848 TaxID=1227487 RepID=M0DFS1_HALPD|nr:hypothetical protein [Halogeometricum pallidum]ELZ33653.1 hypothetical protein C474_04293 [Halogeometricum pallidum JCM 14848]